MNRIEDFDTDRVIDNNWLTNNVSKTYWYNVADLDLEKYYVRFENDVAIITDIETGKEEYLEPEFDENGDWV